MNGEIKKVLTKYGYDWDEEWIDGEKAPEPLYCRGCDKKLRTGDIYYGGDNTHGKISPRKKGPYCLICFQRFIQILEGREK